jgi:hypothetical protein
MSAVKQHFKYKVQHNTYNKYKHAITLLTKHQTINEQSNRNPLEKFKTQIDRLIARVAAEFGENFEKLTASCLQLTCGLTHLKQNLLKQAADPDVQPPASNVAATEVAGIIELTSQVLISIGKK